jgi:hypothetical protein
VGLRLAYLPLLDAVARHGGFPSPVWAIGSQQWGEQEWQIAEWAAREGHDRLRRDPTVRSLFEDRYGAEYLDFDLNDDASVKIDLGRPVPPEYRAGAGTVLDSGTVEHIFDLGQAFENMHDMLRAGGLLVELAPITWWEHGFVNFNPKLFAAIADANEYEPLVEAYLFRATLPGVGERHLNVFVRDGDYHASRKLWVDRVLHRVQPSRALFFFAARKQIDAPFRVPYEVFENW